jgi:hypothetical protein
MRFHGRGYGQRADLKEMHFDNEDKLMCLALVIRCFEEFRIFLGDGLICIVLSSFCRIHIGLSFYICDLLYRALSRGCYFKITSRDTLLFAFINGEIWASVKRLIRMTCLITWVPIIMAERNSVLSLELLTLKILILGDQAVGKTALLMRYTKDQFYDKVQ